MRCCAGVSGVFSCVLLSLFGQELPGRRDLLHDGEGRVDVEAVLLDGRLHDGHCGFGRDEAFLVVGHELEDCDLVGRHGVDQGRETTVVAGQDGIVVAELRQLSLDLPYAGPSNFGPYISTELLPIRECRLHQLDSGGRRVELAVAAGELVALA